MFNPFTLFRTPRTARMDIVPNESEFDVLTDIVVRGVTLTKRELVQFFLDWNQERHGKGIVFAELKPCMFRNQLAALIEKDCTGFRNLTVQHGCDIATIASWANGFSDHVITAFRKAGLIKQSGSDSRNAEYTLSARGAQVRQYYVLKTGLRGTAYDMTKDFMNIDAA